MSNTISNSAELYSFTIRLSPETYDALMLYVDEVSDGPMRTSKAAAARYLIDKALKAEKGEQYVPYSQSVAV